jgi:hypothetical protein
MEKKVLNERVPGVLLVDKSSRLLANHFPDIGGSKKLSRPFTEVRRCIAHIFFVKFKLCKWFLKFCPIALRKLPA